MTWTRTFSTGSGALEFRLAIEGLKYEPVTASSMAGNAAAAIRAAGLQREGIVLSENSDLRSGKLKLGAMSLRIADIDGVWTTAFAQKPQKTTWLSTDASTSDTNIEVLSTDGWTTSDHLHTGTEAMSIDAVVDANNFTVTRAALSTIAQKHWTGDGAHLQRPEITDRPAVLEGRRVRLYVYGSNEIRSSEGTLLDGTLIWTGVVATEPVLTDGAHWEISIDPLTRLTQGDLGADLEEPFTPRGIYYPWNAPLYLGLYECFDETQGFGGGTRADPITLSGFFETQEAFITELQSRLATVTAGFSTTVSATTRGVAGWDLTFTTAGASPKYVLVFCESEVDGVVGSGDGVGLSLTDADGLVDVVVISTTYTVPFDAPVPRGAWGTSQRQTGGHDITMDLTATTTAPEYRIYCGGLVTLDTDITAAQIEWSDTATTEIHPVTDRDDTDRWLEAVRPFPAPRYPNHVYGADGGALPSIKAGREYGTGTDLAGFLTAVTTDAPTYANIGGAPFFTDSDCDLASIAATIAEASGGRGFLTTRRFMAFGPASLEEWIAEHAKLYGVFPCLTSAGKITVRRLRLPVITEVSLGTIDADRTLMDGSWPAFERNAYGSVNTVLIRTGFNPVTEDFDGDVYQARDVTAFGRNKAPRITKIEAQSNAVLGEGVFTPEEVQSIVSPIFGVFGAPYATITLEVPLLLWPVLLGDVVQLTSKQLPDADDGTRGWTDPKPAMVIGRSWDMATGRGTFTLLVHEQRIAGYAPTMLISSTAIQNPGTDTDHILTVTGDDPDGNTWAYIPSGTTATDWFEVGYAVRIYEWDATTPTTRKGTVTAVTATTVRVTFTAAWTGLGGVPYILGFDSASFVATAQKVFCFIAGTDNRIGFASGDVPARVLA